MLELIGNTPLVRLKRLSEEEGITATLAMKMETTNPGGSSKDRPALQMILDAEASGDLLPGGTIVEPTSGNTGVGLAIVAAQRGYQCIFVMTDKVAPEKVDLLRAYGAEVVVCPVAVPPDDPESYYSVAERLVSETPNAYRPNQYANPSNPAAHVATTGPELWRQTDGRLTHFIAGAGTCGTLTGVARYLKEQDPGVRIIAADPEGSVYSGGSGRPYLVEGVGEDFFPDAWQENLYDDIIAVSDAESFSMARRVARTEGILVGGSGGMVVAAAIKVAKAAGPDDVVVVLNPDSGRGYLSKVFNDDWMANFGFTTSGGRTLADVGAGRWHAGLAVRQPRRHRSPRHRPDAHQRCEPVAGVQEHATVCRGRGDGGGRRAGVDAGGRRRPGNAGPSGGGGAGPTPAHHRHRPGGRPGDRGAAHRHGAAGARWRTSVLCADPQRCAGVLGTWRQFRRS